MTEDVDILEAQKRLEYKRATLRRMREQEARERLEGRGGALTIGEDLKDITSTNQGTGITAEKREVCPKCGSREPVSLLATNQCRGCVDAARFAREDIKKRLAAIPERYRGSFDNPPAWMDQSAVQAARKWLDYGGHLLTIGARRELEAPDGRRIADNPTAAGKSTLAGIVACEAIRRGKRVRWFDAADLDADIDEQKAKRTSDAILASDFAVIDGFGKEAGGANPTSDICKRRIGISVKLPNRIHLAAGKRFIVTLDITGEQGKSLYGAAEMRRIASPENATCIVLTRQTKLVMGGF